MRVEKTPVSGLMVVQTETHSDHRGAFSRLFCEDQLQKIMGGRSIVQINQSRTSAIGAVRGLHYQHPPHAEMKFVRCLKGRVWDVAVDLRAGSPTFLKWHAVELSAENKLMMVLPEGFAHGFQALEENSELLYLHTTFYAPTAEGGIRPTDNMLAIDWPLPIQDLSDRDRNHPMLTPDFTGLIV